jgi:hypothetical protein
MASAALLGMTAEMCSHEFWGIYVDQMTQFIKQVSKALVIDDADTLAILFANHQKRGGGDITSYAKLRFEPSEGYIENRMIRSGPNQKFGIDMPTSANNIDVLSNTEYCLEAAIMPNGIEMRIAMTIAPNVSSRVAGNLSIMISMTG